MVPGAESPGGHAAKPGAGGHTPSDFPLVRLTQAEIDRLESDQAGIEEIWPLSPLQEGLLFHALYDPQASDLYAVQLVLGLEGSLNGGKLRAAGEAVLRRHSNLRACFYHGDLSQPVQVVVPEVALPWCELDLSGFEEWERQEQLARFLSEDRARRFDLGAAPLLRFTLIRLAAGQHQLVMTNHHILMDGWSLPVLLGELFEFYASDQPGFGFRAGDSLSRVSGLAGRPGSRGGNGGVAEGADGVGGTDLSGLGGAWRQRQAARADRARVTGSLDRSPGPAEPPAWG